MTEQTPTKLGQERDFYVDIIGFGHAAEVDLLSDEIPILAWDVGFLRTWWYQPWGTLYLTSHRLVWIRWRNSFPWTQKSALAPLQDVLKVEGRRMFSRAGFLPLLVVHLKGNQPLVFLPVRGTRPDDIALEITSILRERGLLRD